MRKPIGLVALLGLAAVALARAGSAYLGDFAKAIHEAKALEATYTVQEIGGVGHSYTVDLKKPNLARIDTPEKLIVADGAQIVTLDKSTHTYFKQPETTALLKDALKTNELEIWSGFFDANAYQPDVSRDLGQRTRAGQTLLTAEATYAGGKKVVTYGLDQNDKVARQAQIEVTAPSGKSTYILNTKSVELNGNPASGTFAFNPPADAKETTLAEMQASKWITDLEEAKRLAAASGKKIFVDFYATWCEPCKMLENEVFSTERFKNIAAKNFVLCRIDVDAQKSVARAYQIEAMPTQMVLDARGSILLKQVGYGGPEQFYGFIAPALR